MVWPEFSLTIFCWVPSVCVASCPGFLQKFFHLEPSVLAVDQRPFNNVSQFADIAPANVRFIRNSQTSRAASGTGRPYLTGQIVQEVIQQNVGYLPDARRAAGGVGPPPNGDDDWT